MTEQGRTSKLKEPVSREQEQSLLLEIVETWALNEFPTYRGFRCANCQQYKNEAWYHTVNTGDESGNFRLPLHLCNDTCEAQFQAGTLTVSGETQPHKVDRASFGNQYQFSKQAQERFSEIVASWPEYKEPELKAFTCDQCQADLEIDEVDGARKGYHVWWKMPDNKTLTELHFHKECGHRLGIQTKEELEKK